MTPSTDPRIAHIEFLVDSIARNCAALETAASDYGDYAYSLDCARIDLRAYLNEILPKEPT